MSSFQCRGWLKVENWSRTHAISTVYCKHQIDRLQQAGCKTIWWMHRHTHRDSSLGYFNVTCMTDQCWIACLSSSAPGQMDQMWFKYSWVPDEKLNTLSHWDWDVFWHIMSYYIFASPLLCICTELAYCTLKLYILRSPLVAITLIYFIHNIVLWYDQF